MDRESFLKAVAELIHHNFPRGNIDGMLAARIGVLVSRAYPNVDLEQFGFFKLRFLLEELARRGIIRTGHNRKNAYAIWLCERVGNPPTPSSTRDLVTENIDSQPAAASRSKSLRKDVWNAFVLEFPEGRRFIHRTRGIVQMNAVDSLKPESEWSEIEPISREVQIGWALQHLEASSLAKDPDLVNALEQSDWYTEYPRLLRKHSYSLVSQWNRYRTSEVLRIVREWSQANQISEVLIFDAAETSFHGEKVQTKSGQRTPRDARRLILNAVEKMDFRDLLTLPIPAGLLLDQLGLISSDGSNGDRQ